jgi:uncharacterized membrane protein YphA (DoxX/SURF4 family)
MATTKAWFRYFVFLLRMFLWGILLFSGYMKSLDLDAFIEVLYLITFISFNLATYLAFIIVALELLLGALLILGLFFNTALKVTIHLLILFTIFLASVRIFGLEVKECGCFGKISSQPISVQDIIRNLLFIGIALILIKNQQVCRSFSIDHKLLRE